MNNTKKHDCLPPMVANMLNDPVTKVDNLFADTWRQLRFNSLISESGFGKRSGAGIVDVVFLLLIWKWINVSSLSMFCSRSMGLFSHANKDVLYDTLKREDINWREFNLQVAQRIYVEQALSKSRVRAFVLDDSIKQRRGKKLEGVSSYRDGTTGRQSDTWCSSGAAFRRWIGTRSLHGQAGSTGAQAWNKSDGAAYGRFHGVLSRGGLGAPAFRRTVVTEKA